MPNISSHKVQDSREKYFSQVVRCWMTLLDNM